LLIGLFTVLSQASQSALGTQEQCNSKNQMNERKKGLFLYQHLLAASSDKEMRSTICVLASLQIAP